MDGLYLPVLSEEFLSFTVRDTDTGERLGDIEDEILEDVKQIRNKIMNEGKVSFNVTDAVKEDLLKRREGCE